MEKAKSIPAIKYAVGTLRWTKEDTETADVIRKLFKAQIFSSQV